MARLFKLLPISASGSEYDVTFNPRDMPEASVKSVLEIYHPDALKSRLLVQVHVLRDDVQQPKDTISLSSNIVKTFSMKVHKDVYVRVISPSDVAVTLVEVRDVVLFLKAFFSAVRFLFCCVVLSCLLWYFSCAIFVFIFLTLSHYRESQRVIFFWKLSD